MTPPRRSIHKDGVEEASRLSGKVAAAPQKPGAPWEGSAPLKWRQRYETSPEKRERRDEEIKARLRAMFRESK